MSSARWAVAVVVMMIAALLAPPVVGAQDGGGSAPPAPVAPDDAPFDVFDDTVIPFQQGAPTPPPPVLPAGTVGGAWSFEGGAPTINGQVEGIANGEAGGALHTVLAHPTNADIIYVGGANGGIWKTTNGTSASPNWTPLTDFESSLSIGAMEFDTTDATRQTIVAGFSSPSSFGGVSGLLNGLLRTTDGGATWTQINIATNGFRVSGIAARGNTIAVSTSNCCVIYTNDLGANWFTGVAGAAFDLVDDLPLGNPATLFAGVQFQGIFRSTNTGTSYTNISVFNAGLAAAIADPGNNNIEMAVAPTTGRLYVAVIKNGQPSWIGYSDNPLAATPAWTQMDLPMTPDGEGGGIAPREKPGSQGGIHFSIVADPANANIVYVGGDRQPRSLALTFPNSIGANDFSGRLFRGNTTVAPTGGNPSPQWDHLTHSDNVAAIPGGGTANDSAPHADSREMVFDANGNILETDDTGIYRRTSPTNNTGDWFSINGNMGTGEYHDAAYDTISNRVIAGAQDNGTVYQDNADAIFDHLNTGDGGDVAVDAITLAGANQSIRYSSFQVFQALRRTVFNNTGGIVSTTFPPVALGGTPFANLGDVAWFDQPIELNKVDPTKAIFGTRAAGFGRLYMTDDGFSTITIGEATGQNVRALAYGGVSGGVPNADVMYYGVGSDLHFRNGGAPVNLPAYPGGPPVDIVMHPTDWNTVYVIDTNKVYRSTNAGANWTDVTGTFSATGLRMNSVEYVTGMNSIGVATNLGVFAMDVNTLVWSRLGSALPNALAYDLDYDSADNKLIVGTMGRGAWSLQIGGGGPTCNGLAVDVDLNMGQVPTVNADVILGTPGPDVIVALGGNDTICGQGGNDTINAGPGNDWVDGNLGNDTVFGQDGDDTIMGGQGA
ncbi:MAG: hypothetical protein ACR2QE_05610, partial [Acidimicrobiales bacterium]